MSISSAVLLACDPSRDGADPCLVVAGLPLVLRAVLTLQKAGVTRIALVTSAGRDDVLAAVRTDPRVSAEILAATADDERPLASARELLAGPAIVARHDVVADPVLYKALAGAAQELEGARAVLPAQAGDARAPALVAEIDDDALAAEGARRIETPGWAEEVNDHAGRRRAVRALFEACRKSVDGIVSRNLNRHVSIAMSKLIVDTPISPNHISGFTMALGLVAAACAAKGGYLWTLIGAALLQLDSIIDGVDGELARVRFQQSRLGEWLDNVSDDLTALAFWAGLAVGATSHAYGRWLSLAGWIAVVTHVLYVALSYRELLRRKSASYFDFEWYDAARADWRTRAMRILVLIPRRDFFVFFCLCAAAVGLLTYMLPVIAIACTATLVAGIVRVARQARVGETG